MVNMKLCQDYPVKSGEKPEGHVAQSPRALSRVLSLELKGNLDCRMCPELLLSLSLPRKSSRCSQAPEMERIGYWKVKGQAAADTYPSGHCSAAC
jgi:uncharacterized protein YbbK (DUF523 family)